MVDNEAKLFIERADAPKEKKLQKKTLLRRSKNVWRFLEMHPLIKPGSISKEAGYDQSNFDKYMKERKKMPQNLLLKIEKILSKYGLEVW